MIPPETKSFFKKLLRRSEEFVFEELGRKINLLDKTQTFKITLKVINELEHPLEKCFIFFRRGDIIIDGGLTDTNGIARIELPKGTYEVLIYKAAEEWYICYLETINVMKNITKQIRLKKKTWPPKVKIIPIVKPPITIPCEIPLPKLPLEWL